MNTRVETNVLAYAIVFVVTFFIGGIIGALSLPEFPGRFYVSGIVFGAFATGAGSIIINKILK